MYMNVRETAAKEKRKNIFILPLFHSYVSHWGNGCLYRRAKPFMRFRTSPAIRPVSAPVARPTAISTAR